MTQKWVNFLEYMIAAHSEQRSNYSNGTLNWEQYLSDMSNILRTVYKMYLMSLAKQCKLKQIKRWKYISDSKAVVSSQQYTDNESLSSQFSFNVYKQYSQNKLCRLPVSKLYIVSSVSCFEGWRSHLSAKCIIVLFQKSNYYKINHYSSWGIITVIYF